MLNHQFQISVGKMCIRSCNLTRTQVPCSRQCFGEDSSHSLKLQISSQFMRVSETFDIFNHKNFQCLNVSSPPQCLFHITIRSIFVSVSSRVVMKCCNLSWQPGQWTCLPSGRSPTWRKISTGSCWSSYSCQTEQNERLFLRQDLRIAAQRRAEEARHASSGDLPSAAFCEERSDASDVLVEWSAWSILFCTDNPFLNDTTPRHLRSEFGSWSCQSVSRRKGHHKTNWPEVFWKCHPLTWCCCFRYSGQLLMEFRATFSPEFAGKKTSWHAVLSSFGIACSGLQDDYDYEIRNLQWCISDGEVSEAAPVPIPQERRRILYHQLPRPRCETNCLKKTRRSRHTDMLANYWMVFFVERFWLFFNPDGDTRNINARWHPRKRRTPTFVSIFWSGSH